MNRLDLHVHAVCDPSPGGIMGCGWALFQDGKTVAADSWAVIGGNRRDRTVHVAYFVAAIGGLRHAMRRKLSVRLMNADELMTGRLTGAYPAGKAIEGLCDGLQELLFSTKSIVETVELKRLPAAISLAERSVVQHEARAEASQQSQSALL